MIWLKIAAAINFIAATLHIAIIFGGEKWYLFFGAGQKMAQMAKEGNIHPTLITSIIAIILIIWGLYMLSAAGLFIKLPLINAVLIIITSIYLLRGAVIFILPLFPEQATKFNIYSSIIVLIIGIIHLLGLVYCMKYRNKY